MRGFVRNRGGIRQANGTYRGGTWTAYWEDRRSSAGTRRQRSKGGFATRRDAQAFLSHVLSARERGVYVPPGRTTLGWYLTEVWLPAQRSRLRPTTHLDYSSRIKNHIIPALGDLPLQELEAAHLDHLYADMLDHGGPGGRPLARKTVRTTHGVLRKALTDATRKRLLARNVAIDADPPKIGGPGDHELTVWTPEELRAFLDGIRDHRLAPAYALAAATGMRRGEVLGLRWSDIDLELGTLAVCQTLVSVGYELQRSEPKTSRGRRTISLDARTAAVLRAHRQAQRDERQLLGLPMTRDGLVFTRVDGTPVHPQSYSQLFERTVLKLGLRKVRLHDLRHTYATLALRAGVDPKTVSARLGHATVAFTLDVYTKAVPQLDREAADKVAGLIYGDEQA